MEGQSVRDRSSQAAEPHYEHHLPRYLMLAESVDEKSERENVAGATNQAKDYAPDDQRRFHAVLEAEQRQPEVGEHACLRNEGERSQGLLHCYLRYGGEIEMGIVGHDDSAKQNRHNAGQVNAFGEYVGGVRKHQHHAEFQGRIFTQVDVLQQQSTNEREHHANTGRSKKHKTETINTLHYRRPGRSHRTIRLQNGRS
uniref:Uncharacterized protein n=1 Tax=Photinus pyralis TaxID=7054 RepID=A0A1Y1LIY5_PHOPY